jgi:hypothetical protein
MIVADQGDVRMRGAKRCRDLRRAIAAAVVNDDQLAGIRLLREIVSDGLQGLREPPFLIVSRNDDRKKWARAGGANDVTLSSKFSIFDFRLPIADWG